MRRARRLVGLAGLVALALLAAAGNAAWRDEALPAEPPEARLARLAPHWRLVRPEGPDPAPVAVLLSGCDGPGDNLDLWAATLARLGWASLALDSHAPRGLDRGAAWRLVCAGQALSGAERAGDAAVAIAALEAMPGVDARRVALVGASHGGWAAMELLAALEPGAPPPPGLLAWPEPPEATRARLRGAALLYPYCGPLNEAVGRGPSSAGPPPLLMILAGEDTVTSAARCEAEARRLAAAGARVRAVTLEGAGHGFDQRERSALSPLAFDPAATAEAQARLARFLRALGGESAS